jgi:hypothetical protein
VGWGGPRIVNRTVVNTTTVNVTNINVRNITYVNAQVHNAVIATSSEYLSVGGRHYTRPSLEEVRDWHPAERGTELRPTAANLVPGEGRGVRPPQDYLERPVVATRTPHDPGPALHAVGLAEPERVGPAPRVVSPRVAVPAIGPQTAPRANDAVEQHAAAHAPGIERSRPPPPPSFNDWRGRQQVTATEGRDTGSARAIPSAPPVSNAQPHPMQGSPGQGGRREPAAGGVERRNLPGEPAMKLRPMTTAVAPSRGKESGGAAACKEHECR